MNAGAIRRGFSLIELVIVVVIIGIIGAIAIPRLSRGAEGAADSALTGNLAVLRNAIDLYQTEHGGTFPTTGDIVNQLTQYTDDAGATSATKTGAFIYGPYLRASRRSPSAPRRARSASPPPTLQASAGSTTPPPAASAPTPPPRPTPRASSTRRIDPAPLGGAHGGSVMPAIRAGAFRNLGTQHQGRGGSVRPATALCRFPPRFQPARTRDRRRHPGRHRRHRRAALRLRFRPPPGRHRGPRVQADIEIVRQRAIATSGPWRMVFKPGARRYAIIDDTSTATGSWSVDLGSEPFASTVTLADFGGDGAVTFSAFGRPDSTGTITIRSGSQEITLSLDAAGRVTRNPPVTATGTLVVSTDPVEVTGSIDATGGLVGTTLNGLLGGVDKLLGGGGK